MSQNWLKPTLKFALPVLIVVAAAVVGNLLGLLKSDPPRSPKTAPRPNVEVVTVSHGPVRLQLSSQGTVSPRRQIEWGSEVAGRVIWVSPAFVEGGAVVAGDTLLKLDPTDYRVAVAEAQAAVADAKLTLAEEQSELRRGNSYRANNQQEALANLRQPKLELVEAQLKAAEEKLLQAQKDLAATEIKAPFAGVIDNKRIDMGQYVSTGAALFNLLGTDTVEVRLPITATDISYIPGPEANISQTVNNVLLSTRFGRFQHQWRGRLTRIEQRVASDTRTFFAVAEVDRAYDQTRHSAPLSVGLFVEASIEGAVLEDSVRLPRSALHDDRYVYLVVEGHLQRQNVEVVRSERDSVVISHGLENGDQLVTSRLDLMVDGMQVTAMPASGSQSGTDLVKASTVDRADG